MYLAKYEFPFVSLRMVEAHIGKFTTVVESRRSGIMGFSATIYHLSPLRLQLNY